MDLVCVHDEHDEHIVLIDGIHLLQDSRFDPFSASGIATPNNI